MSREQPSATTPFVDPSIHVSTVECYLDQFSGLEIRGWAIDPSQPATSPVLHVLVDGQQVGTITCDGARPDVVASGKGLMNVGYHVHLPNILADGIQHQLEFRDLRRREVKVFVSGVPYHHLQFSAIWIPKVESYVDGLRYGAFEGWVMRTELGESSLHGDCIVRITCDGVTIGHARANRHRGDAARVFQGPSNCGFRFTPPHHVRSGWARRFQFFLMPEDIELSGSPCQTSLVVDASEGRLLDLVTAVDTMHRDLTRLRRQLHEIVPRSSFSIADYDTWFRLYEVALRERVQADRPAGDWTSSPLVSIVCPVYKPSIKDFRAAIESVKAQTYSNYELVLVDDNSRSKELTSYMADLVAGDSRVRLVTHRQNQGISEATNTAIKHAKGEWIAFFDHDDALVDTAIECMVTAAQKTGALVLYSDEDKINDSGIYSMPALKPDWNHRLMLGVNYVCHLLFVERKTLSDVGSLSTACDGAQDHDLILRLSEHVTPDQIYHVPEILYHWRITAGSTAENVSNKAYAVAAGVKAISDHLDRIGQPAHVKSILNQTLYSVMWDLSEQPYVTIIIPYKDQIAITEQCLRTVLDLTSYTNYDVIMVDNWSTSREAKSFVKKYSKLSNVTFLRVEEDFNYSRLNNLAAAKTDANYLVFMNNDLFVKLPDWLHVIVGEAEADPTVAAVGGKFFYPDGSVQHGGVVLGLGGVAGHVHVGLQASDFGYAGRLLFAQEMSAVTAAGVLVRASAFRQVGGFDAAKLAVAFNDIDLCLKLRQAKYKIIWTPEFVAEHHESLSRGDDERPMQEARFFDEAEEMKSRWNAALSQDPFYHPKFALDGQPFFDLIDPRHARLDEP
jgi:GT2 family glycosyltransferase